MSRPFRNRDRQFTVKLYCLSGGGCLLTILRHKSWSIYDKFHDGWHYDGFRRLFVGFFIWHCAVAFKELFYSNSGNSGTDTILGI